MLIQDKASLVETPTGKKTQPKIPRNVIKRKINLHITTRFNQSGGRDSELETQFFMQTTKIQNKVYKMAFHNFLSLLLFHLIFW